MSNPENKCGTCYHGKLVPQDMTKRICKGGPPKFVPQRILPTGQIVGINGYPHVNATDDSCGAYKPKLILDTGNNKT